MSRRRVAALLLAAWSAALLGGGCGVGPEADAHRAAPEAVPFDLLEEPEAAPASRPSAATTTVYLVADGRLVPVERDAPDGGGLDEVAELLASGPTEAERALGLTSSLPQDQIAGVEARRGVAQVDLAPTFADLNPRDQALAIAQLTYSLTGRPGIGRVGFVLDGVATEVPRGDGTLTADALAREDFATLAEGD